MSKETENHDLDTSPEKELATIKARLDLMQVKYHPSIGLEAARKKLADAVSGSAEEAPTVAQKEEPVADGKETENQRRRRLKNEANKLVRIRLTCMDPNKREWPGEVFTVSNAVVGTITKFVPYEGADEGYHVPHIIYEQLRDARCQVFHTVKVNGRKVRKGKLIKTYAIDVLPQLTKEELADLAAQQAVANSIDY